MWKIAGNIAFWVVWPALFVYLRLGERTRIAVIHEDEVLVVKPWLGSGKWILPGGGLHRGEKPIDGVLRELKEETGLVIEPHLIKSKGQKTIKNSGISASYHLFKADLKEEQLVVASKFEILEFKWLTADEAKRDIVELADLLE